MSHQNRFSEQPEEEAKPPQPPSIKKRFQFTKAQLIGVPLILVIPLLALLGVFDTHLERNTAAADDLLLTVEHPTSIRYKKLEVVSIYVQNLSSSAFPTVTVTVDDAYIGGFSTVTFTPDVDKVTDDLFILHLNDVQPNETRQIEIELQGEHYWRHTGHIRASAGDQRATVTIHTFVFP